MTAPERIYLQWIEDDPLPYLNESVTWCADKIEDDDIEYVRADVARTSPTADDASEPIARDVLTRDRIREILMQHGFTIKEGQIDLKPYVYDAVAVILEAAREGKS
jgi:hypothetical protein